MQAHVLTLHRDEAAAREIGDDGLHLRGGKAKESCQARNSELTGEFERTQHEFIHQRHPPISRDFRRKRKAAARHVESERPDANVLGQIEIGHDTSSIASVCATCGCALMYSSTSRIELPRSSTPHIRCAPIITRRSRARETATLQRLD